MADVPLPAGVGQWLLDRSKRLPGARQLDNLRLLERIRGMHEDNRNTLGAGRMREDLVEEDETASLNRVARLMAADALPSG